MKYYTVRTKNRVILETDSIVDARDAIEKNHAAYIQYNQGALDLETATREAVVVNTIKRAIPLFHNGYTPLADLRQGYRMKIIDGSARQFAVITRRIR